MNLLPFVQSLVNGDAPEIDHGEVLWNLTSELIKRVDGVFDKVQSRVKAGLDEGDLISGEVVETVDTLRTLRHFVREVARREEIRQIVKGGSGQDSDKGKKSEEHNFGMLVDDVDMVSWNFFCEWAPHRNACTQLTLPFSASACTSSVIASPKSSLRSKLVGAKLSKTPSREHRGAGRMSSSVT